MWRKELSHPGEGLCPETKQNCSGSYGHQLPSIFFCCFCSQGRNMYGLGVSEGGSARSVPVCGTYSSSRVLRAALCIKIILNGTDEKAGICTKWLI